MPRTQNTRFGVGRRWPQELVKEGWTPVVNRFLADYHTFGITSAQAMLLIHIISHKWDDNMPFPSARTLAERMGVTEISIRNGVRLLEKKGLIRRFHQPGKPNLYDLKPLFDRLMGIGEGSADQVSPRRSN